MPLLFAYLTGAVAEFQADLATAWGVGERDPSDPEVSLSALRDWLKQNLPAITAAVLILVGAFAIIGLPLIREPGTILQQLSDREFARGVITYVITVGTIGIALALVVGVLIGGATAASTFDKGKEVLVLLIGVMGTILGFYYGATEEQETTLTLAVDSAVTDFAASDSLRIVAYISGGQPPYTYTILVDPEAIGSVGPLVSTDGWVRQALVLPSETAAEAFTLTAQDSGGRSGSLEFRGSTP